MAKTELLRALQRALTLSRRASSRGLPPEALLEEPPAAPLTRRDFLRYAGAAAAGVWTAGLRGVAVAAAAPAPGPAEAPVVILGAGLAGLTAAYRLQSAGQPWRLYEASARYGGRVYTRRDFNADGMFCELGGELVDSDHDALRGLAAELGLALEPLGATKQGVSRNLYIFGGVARTDADLLRAIGPFVERVRADLRSIFGASSRRELVYSDRLPFGRFDRLTLREYLDSMTGVDAWVRSAVELAYVTEMGLEAEKQSALNMLLLIADRAGPGDFELFGDSDEAYRVVGGSGRLADALAARLGLADGGTARYKPSHRLVGVSDRGDKLSLAFETPGGTVEARASRVLCTIPFSVLRDVDGVQSLDLSARKKACIREMGYGRNAKLMLGFTDRYWRAGTAASPPSNGAVFTDLPSQSFWETSRLQPGARGILTNYTGGETGAGRAMSDLGRTLADVERLFPGGRARYDGSSALMNWTRYAHNRGSYICPAPGDYGHHYGAARETECGGRLLFAGEHTSLVGAGYMNGAVESAETAARALLAPARAPAAAVR